jgi:ferritin-like metal-binding protein YciE
MFETVSIHDPKELFAHKLGAALTMENTILEMLEKLIEEANSSELKQQLRTHHTETQGHVRNLEQAFRSLGVEPEDKPCPAIEGIEKEGETNLKLVEDELNDHIILAGAAETEHHEIAVYENLIIHADAMGQDDVVALLRENLEQEQATLGMVMRAAIDMAQRDAARV